MWLKDKNEKNGYKNYDSERKHRKNAKNKRRKGEKVKQDLFPDLPKGSPSGQLVIIFHRTIS